MKVLVRPFLFLSFFALLVGCDSQEDAIITDIDTEGYTDVNIGVDFDDDIITYNTWVEAATEDGGSERVTVALKAYVEEGNTRDVMRLWHSEWPITDLSFERSEVSRAKSGSDSRVTIIDSMLKVITPLRGYDFDHSFIYQVAVIDVDGTPYTMPYERFDDDSYELLSGAVMSNLEPEINATIPYARRLVTFPAKIAFGDYTYSVNPPLTLSMQAEYDFDLGLYIIDYDYISSSLDAFDNLPHSYMWFTATYADGTEANVLEVQGTVSVVVTFDNPSTSGVDYTTHYFEDVEEAPTKNDCTVALDGDPVQYNISDNGGELDEYGERNYNVITNTDWYQAIKFTFEDYEDTIYFLYENTTFCNYFLIKDYLPLKVESVTLLSNELTVTDSTDGSSWWANSTVSISIKIEDIDDQIIFNDIGFSATYRKANR